MVTRAGASVVPVPVALVVGWLAVVEEVELVVGCVSMGSVEEEVLLTVLLADEAVEAGRVRAHGQGDASISHICHALPSALTRRLRDHGCARQGRGRLCERDRGRGLLPNPTVRLSHTNVYLTRLTKLMLLLLLCMVALLLVTSCDVVVDVAASSAVVVMFSRDAPARSMMAW